MFGQAHRFLVNVVLFITRNNILILSSNISIFSQIKTNIGLFSQNYEK